MQGVLGVRYETLENITVKPYVPEDTTYAKGWFYCGMGKVSVEWKVHGTQIEINVSSPEGVKVCVEPPEGYKLQLRADGE